MQTIDPSRKDLVEAFRRNPLGTASGDLRRLLNALRLHPDVPPYVLVCIEPFRKWCIAVKRPGRGTPVEPIDAPVYTDPLEAEWAVFKLRWEAVTGEVLES